MAQHICSMLGHSFFYVYIAVDRNGKNAFIAHLRQLVYNKTMLTSCNILHRKGVFLSWNM